MTHAPHTHRLTRTMLALAASLSLALPFALAQGAAPRIDAGSVPFADGVTLAGVDLAWHDGLVLVLGTEGLGALGDVVIPAYDATALPSDALGRIQVAEVVARSGLATPYVGGVAFVQSGSAIDALADLYAARLAELGFDVSHAAGERQLAFHRDGLTYRAVFGTTEDGIQVYLGL